MANKRDYYEVLGVDKKASADQIKAAYRKLAKECHPDLHPDDKSAEARFKEINEAHAVLSDPDKRAKYDQFGMDGPFANGFDPNQFGGFGGMGGFGGIDSIFDQLFGGMGGGGTRRANAPRPGNDLRYNLRVSFEEAAKGCKKSFEFMREENCAVCHGSGAKPGTQPETCATCKGSGQVRVASGFMVTVRPCSSCGGLGKIIKERCADCGGNGRTRRKRTAHVNIPAGIEDGQVIVMSGQGEPGRNGGPAGDLQIVVSIRPHKLFQRQGSTLFLEMPLSFTQAALGADLELPTLDGNITYRIPEGTQTGATFRIKGKGIQMLNSHQKGDLVLKVRVETPRKLNDKQKEILRSLEESMTGKEYGEGKSFVEKVRNIFS